MSDDDKGGTATIWDWQRRVRGLATDTVDWLRRGWWERAGQGERQPAEKDIIVIDGDKKSDADK